MDPKVEEGKQNSNQNEELINHGLITASASAAATVNTALPHPLPPYATNGSSEHHHWQGSSILGHQRPPLLVSPPVSHFNSAFQQPQQQHHHQPLLLPPVSTTTIRHQLCLLGLLAYSSPLPPSSSTEQPAKLLPLLSCGNNRQRADEHDGQCRLLQPDQHVRKGSEQQHFRDYQCGNCNPEEERGHWGQQAECHCGCFCCSGMAVPMEPPLNQQHHQQPSLHYSLRPFAYDASSGGRSFSRSQLLLRNPLSTAAAAATTSSATTGHNARTRPKATSSSSLIKSVVSGKEKKSAAASPLIDATATDWFPLAAKGSTSSFSSSSSSLAIIKEGTATKEEEAAVSAADTNANTDCAAAASNNAGKFIPLADLGESGSRRQQQFQLQLQSHKQFTAGSERSLITMKKGGKDSCGGRSKGSTDGRLPKKQAPSTTSSSSSSSSPAVVASKQDAAKDSSQTSQPIVSTKERLDKKSMLSQGKKKGTSPKDASGSGQVDNSNRMDKALLELVKPPPPGQLQQSTSKAEETCQTGSSSSLSTSNNFHSNTQTPASSSFKRKFCQDDPEEDRKQDSHSSQTSPSPSFSSSVSSSVFTTETAGPSTSGGRPIPKLTPMPYPASPNNAPLLRPCYPPKSYYNSNYYRGGNYHHHNHYHHNYQYRPHRAHYLPRTGLVLQQPWQQQQATYYQQSRQQQHYRPHYRPHYFRPSYSQSGHHHFRQPYSASNGHNSVQSRGQWQDQVNDCGQGCFSTSNDSSSESNQGEILAVEEGSRLQDIQSGVESLQVSSGSSVSPAASSVFPEEQQQAGQSASETTAHASSSSQVPAILAGMGTLAADSAAEDAVPNDETTALLFAAASISVAIPENAATLNEQIEQSFPANSLNPRPLMKLAPPPEMLNSLEGKKAACKNIIYTSWHPRRTFAGSVDKDGKSKDSDPQVITPAGQTAYYANFSDGSGPSFQAVIKAVDQSNMNLNSTQNYHSHLSPSHSSSAFVPPHQFQSHTYNNAPFAPNVINYPQQQAPFPGYSYSQSINQPLPPPAPERNSSYVASAALTNYHQSPFPNQIQNQNQQQMHQCNCCCNNALQQQQQMNSQVQFPAGTGYPPYQHQQQFVNYQGPLLNVPTNNTVSYPSWQQCNYPTGSTVVYNDNSGSNLGYAQQSGGQIQAPFNNPNNRGYQLASAPPPPVPPERHSSLYSLHNVPSEASLGQAPQHPYTQMYPFLQQQNPLLHYPVQQQQCPQQLQYPLNNPQQVPQQFQQHSPIVSVRIIGESGVQCGNSQQPSSASEEMKARTPSTSISTVALCAPPTFKVVEVTSVTSAVVEQTDQSQNDSEHTLEAVKNQDQVAVSVAKVDNDEVDDDDSEGQSYSSLETVIAEHDLRPRVNIEEVKEKEEEKVLEIPEFEDVMQDLPSQSHLNVNVDDEYDEPSDEDEEDHDTVHKCNHVKGSQRHSSKQPPGSLPTISEEKDSSESSD